MNDLECPYCGHMQEPDDCCEEGFAYQHECCKCEKTFVFYTSISFYYNSGKADCLNGAKHKYKPTNTYPYFCGKMECEDCEKERALTKEEWKAEEIRRGFDLKKELLDFFKDNEKAEYAYNQKMGVK